MFQCARSMSQVSWQTKQTYDTSKKICSCFNVTASSILHRKIRTWWSPLISNYNERKNACMTPSGVSYIWLENEVFFCPFHGRSAAHDRMLVCLVQLMIENYNTRANFLGVWHEYSLDLCLWNLLNYYHRYLKRFYVGSYDESEVNYQSNLNHSTSSHHRHEGGKY